MRHPHPPLPPPPRAQLEAMSQMWPLYVLVVAAAGLMVMARSLQWQPQAWRRLVGRGAGIVTVVPVGAGWVWYLAMWGEVAGLTRVLSPLLLIVPTVVCALSVRDRGKVPQLEHTEHDQTATAPTQAEQMASAHGTNRDDALRKQGCR